MTNRVACVQFDCRRGQVERNVETVRRLTSASLRKDEVELIVLPEMALSGYCFGDEQEIRPFLENPRLGEHRSPSLALAKELALRFACFVSIGLPCEASTFATTTSSAKTYNTSPTPFDARPTEARSESVRKGAYNASLLVDARGNVAHIFRKHFAFENDKTWSQEGPGFEWIELPSLGRVCFAICMDINPYNFTAPFDAFELARYCQRESVDTLVLSKAWLASKEDEKDAREPYLQHCNYLALRLSPLLPSSTTTKDERGQPFEFIACNRCGKEDDVEFAGFSCALHFEPSTMPRLEGCLGSEEGVAVFTIPAKSIGDTNASAW